MLERYGKTMLQNFFEIGDNWKDDIKIFQFLNNLKSCSRQQTEELKKFCKEQHLDFRLAKNNLMEVLATFKRAEVWGNEERVIA
jgi:hypothetical protein